MHRLSSVLVICLVTKTTFATFRGSDSGWHGVSNYGATNYDSSINNAQIHQDLSSFRPFSSFENSGDFHAELDQKLNMGNVHTFSQPISISEHVEVTKPLVVPIVKNIGVPVAQPVAIPVPHPVAVTVAQPYPVQVPVAQPIPVPVMKTIAIPVEKKVPYPIEKIIPVPVEKLMPVTIEKHVPVPIEAPYPIHIPVYKHIFHRRTRKYRRRRVY
ncbi:zinc finger protein 512B-like isoform X1 [Cataglyphis hispanica]|uniref:zinc finger protein 512B-like isoform X1 n=1 Tax=Cataglyphis hispanica TaxID=1086592 RepID=UPI00217FC7D1|nr:zinc finger protein 512B-like isoform X1 [Cataglyphis hispanica]